MNFFKLGFEHIIDLNAIDHYLYIITLCAIYSLKEWKSVLYMISAFTVGHCITLVLSTFEIIPIINYVDIIIPFTILVNSIFNVINYKPNIGSKINCKFIITICFGLIHGLAFAGNFKVLLFANESIITPLLSFNIGIEIGQLCIIGIYFALSYLFIEKVKLNFEKWTTFISGIGFGVSFFLIIQFFK